MLELTDAARRCLDEYLADVRSSLRHCPSVDAAEIERDVVEHIEHALSGAPLAVDAPELQGVLRGLGSPAQWVPQEERSHLQRFVAALKSGPDDLRLGYLALGVLAGTLLLAACLNLMLGFGGMFPFLLLGIAASFLLARASLSAATGVGCAEKWLNYPSLIVVYVPVTALILLLPLAAAILTEVFLTEPGGPQSSILSWARSTERGEITAFSLVTFGSAWWALLSFAAWWRPSIVRDGYAPFAPGFRRRSALLGFSVLCLLIFLACVAVWVHTVRRHLGDVQTPVQSPAPASRDLKSGPPPAH
jgi:hypothetical protein